MAKIRYFLRWLRLRPGFNAGTAGCRTTDRRQAKGLRADRLKRSGTYIIKEGEAGAPPRIGNGRREPTEKVRVNSHDESPAPIRFVGCCDISSASVCAPERNAEKARRRSGFGGEFADDAFEFRNQALEFHTGTVAHFLHIGFGGHDFAEGGAQHGEER